MTTRAQVQTAYTNWQTQMDGLLNTAIDVLNPSKTTTPQIIKLISDTRTKMDAIFADALAQAQALGVG